MASALARNEDPAIEFAGSVEDSIAPLATRTAGLHFLRNELLRCALQVQAE